MRSDIMEVELKLLLAPSHIAAFRRHVLLKKYAVAGPTRQQLVSTYFDTPDLYLWKHQSALRVRKIGRQWVQTFKAGGRVEAGLHQRHEWESEVAGCHPDLESLEALIGQETPWERILSEPGLADCIEPIFSTRFRRTVWMLHMGPGQEVELALDQGIIQHGEAQIPISEIELELKSGNSAPMFDLALELQKKVPLRVSNISKAERGYALLAPHPQHAVKATRLALPRGLNLEQGFQAIIGNCLVQVQANETAVEQTDPEGIHQMRVGLRRLRSALRLFDDVIHCPEELLSELRWLASGLGPARDWHVFSETTLKSVMRDCPDIQMLQKLQQAAAAVTAEKEREAAEFVGSLRYSRLLLMIGSWMEGMKWRKSLAQPEPERQAELEKFAARLLTHFHGKLLKKGKKLRNGTPAERHKVRIAAKRTRYSAEFFQSLYPKKQIHHYVDTLADLQELIGQYHDDMAAGGLLEQLAHAQPDIAQGAGFVEGFLAARTKQWHLTIDKPWRKFSSLHEPELN